MLTQTQELDFVLARAGDLVERPDGWLQGLFAKDGCGIERAPEDPPACCFCMGGALIRASTELIPRPTEYPFREHFTTCSKRAALLRSSYELVEAHLQQRTGRYWSVGNWNDAGLRTQAQVVDVLRKARPCASYAGGAGA